MTTFMTLYEITEFDQYCKDNHIPKKEGFKRFNISEYTYYRSRRLAYTPLIKKALPKHHTINSKDVAQYSSPHTKHGVFIPLEPALPPSQTSTSKASSQHDNQSITTNLTIDINMGNGKEISISGEITINILHEVLISLSNTPPYV